MHQQELERLKQEIVRFMMMYKFAVDELTTKIEILKQEFHFIHDYNPIEHVTSRVKSPESILQKAMRKKVELTLPSIKENIRDIAGVRIVCSFVSDIYRISEMLQKQAGLHVEECRDYITNPKPNGYRSLHLIVKVPVFTSEGTENVWAEIQIRTIAMDFWASLEHKLNYKYNYEIPQPLVDELRTAADAVAQLDSKMERIRREVNNFKANNHHTDFELQELWLNNQKFNLPADFLHMLLEANGNRK